MKNIEKGKAVQKMFAAIAHRYDLLNFLLSFGVDKHWRKKAVHELIQEDGKQYLDIATGTGDIAIEVASQADPGVRTTGMDFVLEMLLLGNKKLEDAGLSQRIFLEQGDAMDLPYKEGSFDGVICSFGVRNFSDVSRGIGEMKRVLREGGKLVILEFTMPSSIFFRPLYYIYFNYVLPVLGGLISGSKDAYTYLPESVARFNKGEELKSIMEAEGFREVTKIPLTFGIAALHIGKK